jgi:hypothetical protein
MKGILDQIKDGLRRHFGFGHGPIPRFNQTQPVEVRPPDRARRKEVRQSYRWRRTAGMRMGGPVLTGERLRKTVLSCSFDNLRVKPRYVL